MLSSALAGSPPVPTLSAERRSQIAWRRCGVVSARFAAGSQAKRTRRVLVFGSADRSGSLIEGLTFAAPTLETLKPVYGGELPTLAPPCSRTID